MLDVLRAVAAKAGRPPAQVALAWASRRPGISSLIIGASKANQLTDNVASLDVALTPDQVRALDEAGGPEPMNLYTIFTPMVNRMVFGGESVTGW